MDPKYLNAIGIGIKASEDILAALGHNSVASAVAEYSSLAPVFINIFDAIRGLAHHGAATAPATK